MYENSFIIKCDVTIVNVATAPAAGRACLDCTDRTQIAGSVSIALLVVVLTQQLEVVVGL